MLNPWLGIGLVLASLVGLLAALHVYQRRRAPDPEVGRKLLHVGAGGITFTFPWVFAAAWPVLLTAAVSVVGLLALKASGSLLRRLGGAIRGVARKSLGEIYFLPGVAVLFVLSAGDVLLFCMPLLQLTLADAAAALIGTRYGLHRYVATEGEKTVEGSLACLVIAFLSAEVPLLLFGDVGRAKSLLIALSLGLAVTLLEAVGWQGLDNLFIPVGACVLLKALLELDVAALAVHLGATVGLVGLFALVCRQRTIRGRATSTSHRVLPRPLAPDTREALRHATL
jgi:phytol kinase